MKIRPVGDEIFHADGQTVGREADSRFSQLCETRIKPVKIYQTLCEAGGAPYNVEAMWIADPKLRRFVHRSTVSRHIRRRTEATMWHPAGSSPDALPSK